MQEMIVGLIVAYAAWVVAKRYAPASVRRFVRRRIVRVAKKIGLEHVVQPDVKLLESSCSSGCGTCGGCGTAAAKPQEPSSSQPSNQQFTIATIQVLKQVTR